MFTPPSKATGILRHHFHGDYSCTIGLQIPDAESAARSLTTLGESWHVGERSSLVLIATLTSEELDAFKAHYKPATTPCGRKGCRHKCVGQPIDNVNHSVDVGGQFTVEIAPPIPARAVEASVEQINLF